MRATLRTPWVEAEIACAPGEVLAVVGPNGAGKTTLLRALAGLVPCTGSVEVAGREVGALPPYARGVGWVPQAPSLLAHLTARDNAAYALRARGVPRRTARAAADAWLTRLGVGELAPLRPAQLSGGQTARVALARALVAEPDLLLLDEPLSALDVRARADARAVLRATLAGGRAAVLLVTHDEADVTALADRVVRLEGGRLTRGAAE